DPADYERLVMDRVEREIEAGGRIFLGVGALHHIALARDLASRFDQADESLGFYLDIHLYVANRFALATLAAAMPRISFAYFYIEGGAEDFASLVDGVDGVDGVRGILPRLAPVDAAFVAPLFLSAGCLRKHHAEGGTCPSACTKVWLARLRDRDRRYVAFVDDCVSMLFREDR
ncbi:MAG: hypothetical protein Q8M76_02340, partial [Spirochaetaceae bacterium]|nr:hypothetical protein [Spirochaetaceae bacterium]